MSKEVDIKTLIQSTNFSLKDVEKKILEEYQRMKERYGGLDDLNEQIEIQKILDSKLTLLVNASQKRIELAKVLERFMRPSENPSQNEQEGKSGFSSPTSADLARIKEELFKESDVEYEMK